MANTEQQKELAANAALEYVTAGSRLGVGTGTTTEWFIKGLLASNVRPEAVVASSERSAQLLEAGGLQVADLNDVGKLDQYVDGADEYTESFTLVKGGGGAHTREKILAAAAAKFIVIADESKRVDVLGKFPVAVEVLPMARSHVARRLIVLGADVDWREGFVTDEGNVILDCRGLDCTDAPGLERKICSMPGVVDCGLCALRAADLILTGCASGQVQKLLRRS